MYLRFQLYLVVHVCISKYARIKQVKYNLQKFYQKVRIVKSKKSNVLNKLKVTEHFENMYKNVVM